MDKIVDSVEIKEDCNKIQITINKDKILSEFDTKDLIDEIKYRYAETDFLSDCDTEDLYDELASRNFDMTKLVGEDDLTKMLYNNMSNIEMSDMIHIVCKNSTSKKYLDKNDMKNIINDYIDNYI